MERNLSVGLKIKIISELISKYVNNSFRARKLDLTFQQTNVLRYLCKKPGYTAPLKEIEKDFGAAQATMAGLIVRLEEKDLVTTSYRPDDRRIKMVTISEKGQKMIRKMMEYRQKMEDMLISGLSEQEVKSLNHSLDTIYDNLIRREKEES